MGVWLFFGLLVFTMLIVVLASFRKQKVGLARADIAQSAIAQIGLAFATLTSGLTTDWKHQAISWLNRLVGDAVIPAPPDMHTKITLLIAFIATLVIILVITQKRIQKFEGSYFSSDDLANIDPTDSGLKDLPSLLSARFRIKVNGQPDAPLINLGENPKSIRPSTIQPSWKNLSLSLVCSANSDLQLHSANWSDSLKCWIVQKIDYFNPGAQNYVVVFPVATRPTEPMLENLISNSKESGLTFSEIIVCFDQLEFVSESFELDGNIEVQAKSKSALIATALDLTHYCKSLISEFEIRERLLVPTDGVVQRFSLADTFVPPRVRKGTWEDNSNSSDEASFSNVYENWIKEDGRGQLALLGEFGQGKSSAVLFQAASWAKKYLQDQHAVSKARIPLLIELRGRSPMDSNSPEELLGEWGGRFGLSGRSLLDLVQCGMAVLIFEGFDEVRNASRELDRYQQFNALWQFSFPGSKILFTGRPNFFLGSHETKEIMQSKAELVVANKPHAKIWSLCFLNNQEIAFALRKTPKQVSSSLLKLIEADSALNDIAARPSMLPAIASQWKSILDANTVGSELITSATILDNYIKASFLRKEPDDPNQRRYQATHWKINEYLTKAVALFMLSTEGKNTITGKQIEDCIEKVLPVLDDAFRGEESDADAATSWRLFQENCAQDEARGASPRDRIRALSQEVRSNGILAPDPAGGDDRFYFPHKQFFEFLLSKFYFEIFQEPNSNTLLALRLRLLAPSLNLAAAKEPMILYHLAMQFDPKLLKDPRKTKSLFGSTNILARMNLELYGGLVKLSVMVQPWKYSIRPEAFPPITSKKTGKPVDLSTRSRFRMVFLTWQMILVFITSLLLLTTISGSGTPITELLSFLATGDRSGLDIHRNEAGAQAWKIAIMAAFLSASTLMITTMYSVSRSNSQADFEYFVCCCYRKSDFQIDHIFRGRIQRAFLTQAVYFSPHRFALSDERSS